MADDSALLCVWSVCPLLAAAGDRVCAATAVLLVALTESDMRTPARQLQVQPLLLGSQRVALDTGESLAHVQEFVLRAIAVSEQGQSAPKANVSGALRRSWRARIASWLKRG
jgi:hypothetical protein